MPWANPEMPSIQNGVLKAYVDSVLGDRVQTFSYSAFATLLLEETSRGVVDHFAALDEYEEYPYFLMYLRRYLRDSPGAGKVSIERLLARVNANITDAAEPLTVQRVAHIERGIFKGFMNSRQTAAIFGGEPNGHWKATEAPLIPLIRMSTTVFGGGDREPADIIGEVDRGFYLVGHKTPSIAESRENFRISARKVYEIENGRLGRLFRDGGIMADSRDYLLKVDAVGRDFRLYPIPNCGKGQPMQTKKLGNGGPTMRSRAVITGGRA